MLRNIRSFTDLRPRFEKSVSRLAVERTKPQYNILLILNIILTFCLSFVFVFRPWRFPVAGHDV